MSFPVKPYQLTPALITLLKGDLYQRHNDFTRVAQHHWNIHRFRKIGLPNDEILETWWDPRSRNWITQYKNNCGFQIGEATYSGDQYSAAYQHFFALWEIINKKR